MARPKSAEKRNKLLSVAAQVFAKGGLSADRGDHERCGHG